MTERVRALGEMAPVGWPLLSTLEGPRQDMATRNVKSDSRQPKQERSVNQQINSHWTVTRGISTATDTAADGEGAVNSLCPSVRLRLVYYLLVYKWPRIVSLK